VSHRLTIELDEQEQATLARVAGGDPADAEELARAVITDFLRAQENDPQELAAMLDRIPGAWERTQEGNGQIDAGQGIPLARL
jgi:hypothetical protein